MFERPGLILYKDVSNFVPLDEYLIHICRAFPQHFMHLGVQCFKFEQVSSLELGVQVLLANVSQDLSDVVAVFEL